MALNTPIEWTEATWNPARGCTRISPGCLNCYAERDYARKNNNPKVPGCQGFAEFNERGEPHWTGRVELIESKLYEPLKRKYPTTYFVNSVSDLFHEALPDEAIDRVFAVMALCPQHTFQVLTKRAFRLVNYMCAADCFLRRNEISFALMRPEIRRDNTWARSLSVWPLPNVWLGVSVENQQYADERIPLLLQTPAAVRFISAEPLLGPIQIGLNRWVRLPHTLVSELPFPPVPYAARGTYRASANPHGALSVPAAVSGEPFGIKPGEFERLPNLDWVIVGGESGSAARPFNTDWAQSIVDQCKAAGVPCFVKQLGAHVIQGGERRQKADKKGGDMDEWPHELRVRQMPVQRPQPSVPLLERTDVQAKTEG